MAEEKKGSNILGNAGSIIGGGMQLAGMLGIGNKKQDKRQVEQQRKLNEVNAATSKELADYDNMLKMKMWKDTNYTAQLAEAERAGVSKAAAIGGGSAGVGGATSVSGVNGGGAADAASTKGADTQSAMAIAQIANLNADTEKKKAEASGLGQDVIGKERENKVIDETLEDYKLAFQRGLDVRIIEGEKRNAEWEFEKAVMYDNNFESKDSPKAQEFLNSVKIKAKEVEKIGEEISNLKKSGKNTEADTKLKELDAHVLDFKKSLTEYGINETTANLANMLLKAVLGIRGGGVKSGGVKNAGNNSMGRKPGVGMGKAVK